MTRTLPAQHLARQHNQCETDLVIGSRWDADQGTVLTVLENRGPVWGRTVVWVDEMGRQGITAVNRFTGNFIYIPTHLEVLVAKKKAQEAEAAIEEAMRLRRKAR